jgi:hypothetical protein
MHRRHLSFIAAGLVAAALPLGAQVGVAVLAPAPNVDTSVTLNHVDSVFVRGNLNQGNVLDRLWSLDLDADDRLSGEELPERMLPLLKRADHDTDGFLNADEIAALVKDAQGPRPSNPGFRIKAVSLADVVSDLRLPPSKRERALAMVKNYAVPRNVNNPDSLGEYELVGRLRELLDDEEYENFLAAAARTKNRAQFTLITSDVVR